MYDDWSNDDYYNEDFSDCKITPTQAYCFHDWKPITLVISIVYNCSKCGVKKEDNDEWERSRKR